MGFQERQQIIEDLQKLRETKIVVHITSDRRAFGPILPSVQTKLATEAQVFFYRVLQELGRQPQLDLCLYTGGGQTDSVWPLVSLFREFGEEFRVLVPYKCHSAGTLICLGADTIVMGEASELSPVDPQTGNQFNPVDDIDSTSRRAISVEDVVAYFDFAKDPGKEKIAEEDVALSEVGYKLAFEALVDQVHPLALGGVNRSHKQIRELAKRLLDLHIDAGPDDKRVKIIVDTLTQGRYSHTDILNRKEAQNLLGEDMVEYASEEEQKLMWQLFEQYANALSLFDTFVLLSEVGDNQQAVLSVLGGFIETESTSYIYRSTGRLTQRSIPPPGFQLNIQPGQLLPLIPGFSRDVHIDMQEVGWFRNEEGV